MIESPLKRREKFFERLRHTYRLVFFNDDTLEEVWHIRITVRNVLSIVGTVIIILVIGSMSLVMFTPLRQLVPGYPTNTLRRQIMNGALLLDSLEYEFYLRDRYINIVNAIIAGEEPETQAAAEEAAVDTYDNISFARSAQDSVLRRQVEEEERFNFGLQQLPVAPLFEESLMSRMHLFKPVEGVVSSGFSPSSGHFGVDVVAAPSEVVKSVLDGTVTFSTWTSEAGYVIQIQHAANVISVYKHNASLMKAQGDRVKAGDAVAIVGNSGELTSGPHLHLEIWQSGIPVNPEEYIVF